VIEISLDLEIHGMLSSRVEQRSKSCANGKLTSTGAPHRDVRADETIYN
jgi:hypothetical protein